jgi:hypothetical protein
VLRLFSKVKAVAMLSFMRQTKVDILTECVRGLLLGPLLFGLFLLGCSSEGCFAHNQPHSTMMPGLLVGF